MRIESRFVFRANEEQLKKLYTLAGIKSKPKPSSCELEVIKIFKDSEKYSAFLDELKRIYPSYLVMDDEIFTEQELLSAPILQIVPNGHSGSYPQPEGGEKEENYQSASFDLNTGCKHCINGRLQNRPLRLKSSVKLGKSLDISGIWWLRELIVSKKLKELIETANLTGCEFWPVIKHGKNIPFDDIFQLKITGELPAMSERTKIIHEPFIENHFNVCPYGCGSRTIEGLVYYRGEDLKDIQDFALTKEWFGANDEYWRWPFMSQRAHQLFLDNKIKGVRFYPPVIIE